MSNPQPDAAIQRIGGVAPEIELRGIDGKVHRLTAYLEGKKGAVVVFWSETCSHCVHYDPYLNGFSAAHPELGFFAVASRVGESFEQIRSTAAERNLKFPILHDPGAAVAKIWAVQQTPRVFLLDPGRILMYRGAIDNFKYPEDPEFQSHLEPAIASFLAGKPIERTETASFGCAVQSVYYILPTPMA